MNVPYKQGICSNCGKEVVIYNKSKKLCVKCNTIRLRKLSKEREKKKIESGKALDYRILDRFYKTFWDLQVDKICFETGEKLYKFNRWHVHHLLEKSKVIEAAFDVENCVLLTLEQHSLWHHLTDKRRETMMPKTFEKYLKIKEKYGL